MLGVLDAGYTQARFGEINLNTGAALSTPTGDHLPAATYNGWFIGGGSEYALSNIAPLQRSAEVFLIVTIRLSDRRVPVLF